MKPLPAPTPVVRGVGLILLLAACGPAGTFDSERAFQDVKFQVEQGARIPGTQAHRAVGDWIVEELQSNGWDVSEQIFEYRDTTLRNIVGKGTAPGEPEIIFGAHYDTRPIADHDPVDRALPTPGANDGASGVAVLLELARVIRPESNLWLAFFDAEDSGRVAGWDWVVGSNHFAETLETRRPAVVVIDMVGDADLQLCASEDSETRLRDEVWDVGNSLSHSAFREKCTLAILDDHTPFVRRGYSALLIIDFDYPFWHTSQDTLDKVSAASLAQIGETLQRWIETRSGYRP